jgi:hypothetical protein
MSIEHTGERISAVYTQQCVYVCVCIYTVAYTDLLIEKPPIHRTVSSQSVGSDEHKKNRHM